MVTSNSNAYGFESLDVWKMARDLNEMIYQEFLINMDIKDYPLKDQVNRSAGSVMDNIAEGKGRGGNKEFIQFLYIARGSLTELKSQLFRAEDRKYIKEATSLKLHQSCDEILKKLNGLIHYLKRSDVKGNKFDRS